METQVPRENVKVQLAFTSIAQRLAMKANLLYTCTFCYISRDTDCMQTWVSNAIV